MANVDIERGRRQWVDEQQFERLRTNATVTVEPGDRRGGGGIQDAIDNKLTSGRDWIETVYVEGDHTVSSAIELPSYTRLAGPGKITMSGDTDDANIIQNETYGTGDASAVDDEHIEIVGLTLDGNKSERPSWSDGIMYGIQLRDVENYLIHGVTSRNNPTNGIGLWECPNGTVSACFTNSNGRFGYQLQGAKGFNSQGTRRMLVQGCHAADESADGFSIGHGVQIAMVNCGAQDCGQHGFAIDRGSLLTMGFCWADNASTNGFMVADAGGSEPTDSVSLSNCWAVDSQKGISIVNESRHVTLSDCKTYRSSDHGIFVGGGCFDVTMQNCYSEESEAHGFRIEGTEVRLILCSAYNNGQVTGDGFNVNGTGVDNVRIALCEAVDNQGTSTQRYGFNFANSGGHELYMCRGSGNGTSERTGTTDTVIEGVLDDSGSGSPSGLNYRIGRIVNWDDDGDTNDGVWINTSSGMIQLG